MQKIALFFDGNYYYRTASYYKEMYGDFFSIKNFKRFLERFVETKFNSQAKIVESKYFRGRLTYKTLKDHPRKVEILENDRKFDDVLHIEGITPHYLTIMHDPSDPNRSGNFKEVGIDVLLSLEAYESVVKNNHDVFILFTGDGDYVPLIRKINGMGTTTIIVGTNNEKVRINKRLMSEAIFCIDFEAERNKDARDQLPEFQLIFTQNKRGEQQHNT